MGRRRWSAALGFHLIAAMLFAADADGFRPRPHDWPQWRGPNRTAVSTERGLLQEWPAAGPTLAWKAMNLGRGYATPSVAAGRVFTLGERGGNLFVTAVSEGSGVELWSSNLGGPWKGEGPNSTPTVDGERLYVILPQGELVCLEVATGRERWRRNLTKDFAARFPGRGMSESALVDGDKVVCTPGGEMATLVALDKHSGKTIWQAQVPERDRAGYTSAIVADAAGRRQYIQLTPSGVLGVAAEDGRFLWRYDRPANPTAVCSTPLCLDNQVFAASAYSRGGGLARLSARGANIVAEEVYFTKSMKSHHGCFVLAGGFLYGAHGGNEDVPRLVCLDFRTGEVKWEQRRAGKGSISYADGRLYYRNEDGPMLLIEASPQGYVERGRFTPPDRSKDPAWPHPVIANGRLLLRDQGILLSYDVKKR